MQIKYIGNAGVLIACGKTCIAIDCFCQDESGIYPDLSEQEREMLYKMIDDNTLKTLIFTHEHSDHFFAPDVKCACERNSSVRVFGGSAVMNLLYKERIAKEQLQEIHPPQDFMVGEMHLSFLKTVHDGEAYKDVGNLTVLLEAGGKTVVITGDAKPSKDFFETIGKWSYRVDLLIAPFPYVGLGSSRKEIARYLEVQSIVATHEPRPECDAAGWILNTEKVCKQAQDGLPDPIFAKKQKEWHCL